MTSLRYVFAGEPVDVTVEVNILDEIGSLLGRSLSSGASSRVVVISDTNVWPLYGERVLKALRSGGLAVCERIVAAGEASKSWAAAGELFQFLADQHVGRDAVLVALGGGVVSDLAGFVAATWMRGVRLAICPTTLEGDIDAAIGGKNAINIPGGKNLVGAFHQPFLVAIDPACLVTLPRRDLCAAMAESIKHALISSVDFLKWHEANVDRILALDPAVTTNLIEENIRIKADIVSRDTTEQTGLRVLLNFGHTIGHAIEECCGLTLRHGACVSLGLVAACRLSQRLGVLDTASVERVERLLDRFSLPTRLENPIDPDRILVAMRNDKKARGGTPQFVLLEGIGRPVVRGDISQTAIREVLKTLGAEPHC